MSDVPYQDLAQVIDAECRRLDLQPQAMYEAYGERFDMTADAAYRRLRRARDRGTLTLAEADRWLVVFDLTLDALPNPPEVADAAGRLMRPPQRPHFLTDTQLLACHALYQQGASLNVIAAQIWDRVGYANVHSAQQALLRGFRRLGLARRDPTEATRLALTKHGLARKDGDKAAYSRWLRRRRGLQPMCTETTGKGQPCRRTALRGSSFCLGHDPESREVVRRALELAWAADRPRGEQHHNARLTEDKVRFIRSCPGVPLDTLAAAIGASRSNVSRVRRGETWTHVTDAADAA